MELRMSSKRVAIIGVRHEAMLSSPFLTDETTTGIHYGQAILAMPQTAVTGVVDRLREEPDVEIVPLVYASALPGGGFARALYDRIKSETLRLLAEQGPFDAIMALCHGAAEVDGLGRHGDTDYVCAVRDLVGPDVPIATPFDMHGQVTEELLGALTVLSCQRTAPHRDTYETSRRATDQLIWAMRTGKRPKKAAIHIPILVPGEKAMSTYSPTRELFGPVLSAMDQRPGVIEAHLFVGFGWNDRPWCGMKAVVLTEDDEAAALALASELAQQVWDQRDQFRLYMETAPVREGLLLAQAADGQGIYLSDSGDNVGAGAGGDLTFVLQEALDLDIDDIVVGGIYAPDIVASCMAAGIGATVEIEIGHHVSAQPLPRRVTATVEAFDDRLDTSRFLDLRGSPCAWCRLRIGRAIVTFHAGRTGLMGPGHWEAMGIHPTGHKIYVVKVGYMLPQFEDVMSRHICLISQGISDLDFTRLPYRQVARPVHPLDPEMSWSPADGAFATNRHLLR
jgi:microcystin degradation protein MlrC